MQENLIPGGKSLSGGHTHSPRMNVRLPAGMKDELDRIAEERGTGTSKLVREIIADWLNSRG